MELGNVLYTLTLLLSIRHIYAIQWTGDVPIVEETDCVPKCIKGGVCVYNTKDKRPQCACQDDYYYHETFGCQKTFTSTKNCYHMNSYGEIIKSGPLKNRVICLCKPGYFNGYSNTGCLKKYGCEDVKCARFAKCGIINRIPTCLPEYGYIGDYLNKIALRESLCGTNKGTNCIPPAACTTALNKNGPQSTVCSCPDDMYLTKDKRQCARLETFPPNHVYTVKLAEDTKVFPNKFDIYLEGCFNVHINRDKSRLIYQSRDTLGDLDVNVEIPTSIKSMHFKMTNTTLNIFANDNTKMHPLFTTHFRNVNCKFLPNAHLLEENSNVLIRTESKMYSLQH